MNIEQFFWAVTAVWLTAAAVLALIIRRNISQD